MARDTKERMIDAAVHALERHGFAGMSFTEVVGKSGAARGAIYHHFPGGKTQLAAEAATRTGNNVRLALGQLPSTSPRATVKTFIQTVRPAVERSVAGGGCAVASVTTCGEGESDELRALAASAFKSWTEQLAQTLTTAGMKPREASRLAILLIVILEGAHVLCRAAGNMGAFDQATQAALELAGAYQPRP